MKKIYFPMLFLFVFSIITSTSVLAQTYSYGDILWTDNKEEVIEKMLKDGEYTHYAVEDNLKTPTPGSSITTYHKGVDQNFKTIGKYLHNNIGQDQLSAVGFDRGKMDVGISGIFTPVVFLFTNTGELIYQYFKNIDNGKLVIDSLTEKYGEPKSVGWGDDSLWETDEYLIVVTMPTGFPTASIIYLNKIELSEVTRYYIDNFPDPNIKKEKAKKNKASKF